MSLWSAQRTVPLLDGSSQPEGEEGLAADDGDDLLAAYLRLPKQASPDAAAAGPSKRAGKKGSRTARSQSPLLMDDDMLLDPSPGAAAAAATGGLRGAVAAAAAAVVGAVTRGSKRNKGAAAAANGGPSPDMVRQAAAQQRLLQEQLAQATAAAAEDEDEEIEILDSDDGECVHAVLHWLEARCVLCAVGCQHGGKRFLHMRGHVQAKKHHTTWLCAVLLPAAPPCLLPAVAPFPAGRMGPTGGAEDPASLLDELTASQPDPASAPAAEPAAAGGNDGKLPLVFQAQGHDKVTVRVQRSQPLSHAMDTFTKYAAQHGWGRVTKFMFDGDKLNGVETPEDLGMDADEVIDVYLDT